VGVIRRLLWLAFLFLLWPTLARANQSASGFCQSGGQIVVTSGLNSTTQVMGSFPACTVTVNVHGGGTATIFSDNAGTPLANPFTATTPVGQWQWYAANGHYDVVLSGFPVGTVPSTVTISDIILNDPAQLAPPNCTVTFSATPVFTAGSCTTFVMTLTGNVTSSTITGGLTGQLINFSLTQGAGGPWTLAWPASFANPPLLTPVAAKSEQASFVLLADGNWHHLGAGESVVYDTATNGNVLRINGVTINAVTGSGSTAVLGTAPAIASPTTTGTDSGAETLNNKTLASPAITGVVTGNRTDSGNVSLTGADTAGNLNKNCVVDGALNTTLAAAITCAGSSGVIEISMVAVPSFTTATIPVGVALKFDGPSCLNNTGTLTINGPIVAPPVQIFCGSGSIVLGSSLNSPIQALWFPGSDIGAQINNAYAALPVQGGNIVVAPNSTGNCYNFSTPIAFTTVNKYVTLTGVAPPPTNPNTCTGNSQLFNYTPTTATSAITIDWTPNAGGGYEPGSGIRDFALSNNLCITNGGCGSSAIGINIGPVHSGAHSAFFSNIRVNGFGTGISVPDVGGGSWGMTFLGVNLVWNTTGYAQAKGEEQEMWIGPKIAVNGTGMNFATQTGDVSFIQGSYDSNTSCAFNTNAGVLEINFVAPHFENLNVAGNVCYVTGGSANINITGGIALDDNATGSSTAWFAASTITTNGLNVFSGGQALTSQLFNCGGVCNIQVFDNSPTPLPPASMVFAGAGTQVAITVAGQAPFNVTRELGFTEAASHTGRASQAVCDADSTAHALECSYNNDAFQLLPRVFSSTTATMSAAALNAGVCSGIVTVSVTGAAVTDTVEWSFGSTPTVSDGQLIISAYATTNNVNFVRCNPTAGALTPTAATINFKVLR
jgi:hypothetical protein